MQANFSSIKIIISAGYGQMVFFGCYVLHCILLTRPWLFHFPRIKELIKPQLNLDRLPDLEHVIFRENPRRFKEP